MIEIVRHGTEFSDRTTVKPTKYSVMCPHCSCKFICDNEDIQRDQRKGDSWIYCPECNHCINGDAYYVCPVL